MLVFGERGKPENPGKNLLEQSRDLTTQSTCDDRSGNCTRAVLKEGDCLHHYANPALQAKNESRYVSSQIRQEFGTL